MCASLYDLCMVCVGYVYDLCMECIGFVYGFAHDVCMLLCMVCVRCVRYVYDLCMSCIWLAHGLCAMCACCCVWFEYCFLYDMRRKCMLCV